MKRYVMGRGQMYTGHMPNGMMCVMHAEDQSEAMTKMSKDMKARGMSMEGVSVTASTPDDVAHFKAMGGMVW